jgi:hypothetical protein
MPPSLQIILKCCLDRYRHVKHSYAVKPTAGGPASVETVKTVGQVDKGDGSGDHDAVRFSPQLAHTVWPAKEDRPLFRFLVIIALALGALSVRIPEGRAAAVGVADLLDAKVDYAADFYLVSDNGRFQGTVVHAPGRERRDFGTPSGPQALLLRRDIDQAAVLWPARKWYVSTSFLSVAALVGGLDGVTLDCQAEGHDQIEGEATTRYRLNGNSSGGGDFHGRMWFTRDGILMKLVGLVAFGGRQMSVETGLSHVRRTKTDANAFALPSDYKGLPIDFSKFGVH